MCSAQSVNLLLLHIRLCSDFICVVSYSNVRLCVVAKGGCSCEVVNQSRTAKMIPHYSQVVGPHEVWARS